ncbi:glutamyl-tRNA amidotransferase [Candidatus Curtissbacteria bacterium RIFCSPLOWO2_01_FULL_38_11b]|uniref:Glutamyl-tRNA amidotransferase n=1 Tax=Candidatus Curtissbacteria bacterium RIFCSPLOWO2_01_FULL_38_11b TaxID=1797725 RepID=A0A1F5H231_9BACT|nr:MAG: glutamyl-tRNA amidotransferase [Candidatus Curtissbacteria bacterium RIFCSPLOWO2_01_FULL_38_11b]
MANILDKINQDLIDAQKSKDTVMVSTLRLLLADVKNAQIEKGSELTDEEIINQIQRGAKKRKESIDAYQKANRSDLVDKETRELGVLQKYLPKQLSQDEIGKIVDEIISETGARSPGDIGKVIGQVMAKLRGRADGSMVSEIVKSKLSS